MCLIQSNAQRYGKTHGSAQCSTYNIENMSHQIESLYPGITISKSSKSVKKSDFVKGDLLVLFLRFGWLRSSELFCIQIKYFISTVPANVAICNLPIGVGVLCMKILPNTKASLTKHPDVYITYTTSYGLLVGKWQSCFISLGVCKNRNTRISNQIQVCVGQVNTFAQHIYINGF